MKLRLPIGSKVVGLIFLLLVISISAVVAFSTQLYVADNTALIQQMNADTAASLSEQVRANLEGLNESLRLLGMQLLPGQLSDDAKLVLLPDSGAIACVALGSQPAEPSSAAATDWTRSVCKPALSKDGVNDGVSLIARLNQSTRANPEASFSGEQTLAPLAIGETLYLWLSLPLVKQAQANDQEGQKFQTVVVALVEYARLMKGFEESDLATSYLVNSAGKVLAHPNTDLVGNFSELSQSEIVKAFLAGKFSNGQTRYNDPFSGEAKLGAYRTVGFAGLGVITEVPEAKAFEAANRVILRALLIALCVGSLTLFFGYLFSRTITSPIKTLVRAAEEIARGNFQISLKPKTRDEIADLSLAFNSMAAGLEERDRIKATFSKFHNKEIVDTLLSGEVNLGGEKRMSTMLFTDLRGFTTLSEFLPPEKVVEMLNEYLSKMVGIIRTHGGIVDKFVGDAIMAVWGIPLEDEEGTAKALTACLEMRAALAKLNETRIARNEEPLKMGMGINAGEIIAGNIGSSDRMEYTVIGSAVNTASRLESLTKQYGTDLLVSEAVYQLVRDRFVFESVGRLAVRGQKTEIQIFAVKGYVDEQSGEPVLISTPYSDYAPETTKTGLQAA